MDNTKKYKLLRRAKKHLDRLMLMELDEALALTSGANSAVSEVHFRVVSALAHLEKNDPACWALKQEVGRVG